MIEESLLKSNYIGKDGFSWWLGQVAHPRVWKEKSLISEPGNWGARCKVRIIGYHPFDPKTLPDDDLPWAQVMLDPSFGSSQGGIGGTIDLQGGEACFGFFLDGDDAQQPVVVGLLYRSEGVKNIEELSVVEKERGSRFKPFTGHPGNYVPPTKRDSRAPKELGQTETPPLSSQNANKVSFDSTVGFTRNFDFGIESLGTDFEEFSNGLLRPQYGDAIRGAFQDNPASSTISVEKKADTTIVAPNGCQNNLIGQITQALQDFMAITNGLDKYLDVYLDPVLNEIVNVANIVRNTARQIGGIIKLIINNLRGTIFKCIVWAFRKLVGLVVPPPQQTIVLEAMKKILDIIFCILERLPASIIDFITGLLGDLVDRSINAPLCAIEQWTAGILAKVMDSIEDALDGILSGISWLTNGIGTISSILNQASSLASQIFSFLDCTGLACETPSVWASKFGPAEQEQDNWNRMVTNVNVFRGVSFAVGSIDDALRETPLYSSLDPLGKSFGGLVDDGIYRSCKSKVTNPTSQDDLAPLPIGVKYSRCIPPIVRIVGGGGIGAKAVPIVGNDGSIFSVQIVNGGIGYKSAPTISIVDNSGYGIGARAKAIVRNGSIESIYLTNVGRGYCKGNYSNIEFPDSSSGISGTGTPGTAGTGTPGTAGTGTPGTAGTGTPGTIPSETTVIPGIPGASVTGISTTGTIPSGTTGTTSTNVAISSFVDGCVKGIIVISPGYGYTSGDTVTDGKNIYKPIVSPNSGAIIKVELPSQGSICGFESVPTLTINTNTGVAAELVPIMEYVPSYSSGLDSVSFGTGIGVTSVIDCI